MPQVILQNVDLLYPIKIHNRPTLKDFVLGLFGAQSESPRHVKALDAVTLRVEGGECVGVLGRNGAGKSTLLRAIAGVYPTTAGLRRVDGKIASLFDIAAGFEWNATGWENIELRAYLQGETPQALRDRLEAIAEFTELGDLLDRPLKCFSTGRIMLLSFAIATCFDPEILLIDEFLSTGDLHVREKAVRRMLEMVRGERIVMIASHDLAFLRQICGRAIWLDQGRIREDGPTECVIESYIASAESKKEMPLAA
ncbi:MAG: ABC transporter ATP-binding protein [Planctomycetes bacterium]|nr:ABC transporter ATP-binding protein [Planctomycetota bacterium]